MGGPGAWAWHGFGRRMFFAVALFFGGGLAAVALIGATVGAVLGSNLLAVVITPLILVALVFAGGAWLWRTWRPVRSLIAAAARLADGDYEARVDMDASPAIASVIRSFNDMATRLEGAEAQRRQLILDLGHELRTPLTVIRGELEAVLDGVHEASETELQQLLGEVEVMERLLADLQTLSLSAAGALALKPEAVDLTALASDVVELHARAASDRGVSLTVASENLERLVTVDPIRMREILANLIVNAVRACDTGDRVVVTISTTESSADVIVSDTGSGIEPEDLPLVFDRFHRGDRSAGSGLGLTITRELVEAHGGVIAIDSEPGVGTVVRFQVPVSPSGDG